MAHDLLARIEHDWRTTRPDLDATPMLTVISVQRASAYLQTHLERFFAAHDLTPASFDLLVTLRRSAPPGGLTPGELSGLCAITPPAITKRLDALEALHLIERVPHETDRRATRVRLTRDGRARVDDVLDAHVANEERLLSPLTREERATLRTLLTRLMDAPEATP
ncbi:MarR family winged helix-turn-helix transcriptional regulator [Deinococcus maricopensis]|uniref:Transcriptional regulator, MarR family n=1 Tax=Deinococcus maricopensis (strain DSM 21211 / LMG 22137 / NRRL B-23946 / LB-34) TaxID=709986 RepID=E8UAP6_DEIML|nr:MarR family transcriptional regulator [Deinococcus maricopensis]ADV68135.1 transcriptional regulator, MarR family [Deinococcus maricopensis DSM 21211]